MFRILVLLASTLWVAAGTPADRLPRHLKVRVTLAGGAQLVGVVRDDQLHEIPKEGLFVPVDGPDVPGAGFRLWYAAGSSGYLFVKHEDVKKFESLATLSTGEFYQIVRAARDRAAGVSKADPLAADARPRAGSEIRVVAVLPEGVHAEEPRIPESLLKPAPEADVATPKAERRPRVKTPAPPKPSVVRESAGSEAPAEPSKKAPAPTVEKAPAKAPALSPAEELLRRFPPEEGWRPERRGEIERRFRVIGIRPAPIEREFLENYPAWKEAYDAWRVKRLEAPGERR